MYETRYTPILLSIDSNFDLKLDVLDLQIYGLSAEEIEGYLDFFENIPKEKKDDFI